MELSKESVCHRTKLEGGTAFSLKLRIVFRLLENTEFTELCKSVNEIARCLETFVCRFKNAQFSSLTTDFEFIYATISAC